VKLEQPAADRFYLWFDRRIGIMARIRHHLQLEYAMGREEAHGAGHQQRVVHDHVCIVRWNSRGVALIRIFIRWSRPRQWGPPDPI
jgi:hypothetical protein